MSSDTRWDCPTRPIRARSCAASRAASTSAIPFSVTPTWKRGGTPRYRQSSASSASTTKGSGSRSDGRDLHAGVVGRLAGREGEEVDGIDADDGIATGEVVEAAPAVAHPYRAGRDPIRHPGAGVE